MAAICVVLAALAAVFVTGTAADGGDGAYEVRAIFDNAGFLVEGEEVRIAGAKVGVVSAVDVTGAGEAAHEDGSPAPGKAVVVLRIDDPAFAGFRQDASCLIRPQSLIGEKFVECEPTQPRSGASEAPAELAEIGAGEPGAGQHLLALEQNGKSVDLDLVNNIMREPYPDRFRLILNDLGAGLAARGEELAAIVERSNPALRETNQVLAILARQNRTLAALAGDSDRVIGALARERQHLGGFINQSQVSAQATAERRADLEASLRRFPSVLAELRSTMSRLDAFSRAATPAFADLRQAAPSLTRATRALGPFSEAGTGALASLGDAAEASGPDLVGADPVIRQLRGLARSGAPATANLRRLLASLRKSGGYEQLTQFIFDSAGAVNAFDQYGHFLRALLPANNCVAYVVIVEPGCDTNFNRGAAPGAKAAKAPKAERRGRAPASRQAPADSAAPLDAGDDPSEPRPPDLQVTPSAPPSATAPGPGVATDPGPAAPLTEPRPRGAVAGKGLRAARDLLEFLIGDAPGRRRR